MILTVRDDVSRYQIECPDSCKVKMNHGGTDFLIIPDPEESSVPYWLFDHVLIEAARSRAFGLRLISEKPL